MQVVSRTCPVRGVPQGQRGAPIQPVCLASPVQALVSSTSRHSKKAAPAIHARRTTSVASRRLSVAVAASAAVEGELTVVKTELSPTQRKLVITLPASMCQEGFHATVENLKKIVGDLRGFRKDKIPLSMLVTQCGGQRQFKMTIIEELLMKAMPMALDKIGEPLVPESERIASNVNEMELAFDPAKPFTFEVEYETIPPIVWTKSYKDAAVTIQDSGDFSTDSAAVDGLLRQFLKQKGFQRVVVGRGVQHGDTCIMDIDARFPGSKESLPGMKKSKFPLDTEMDPLNLFKGMEGIKAGEERKFQITFPKDYSQELWQGLAAEVSVKVHEIFTWVLPEFNDEFVKAHYAAQFDSAEEMRKGLLAQTAMERVKHLDQQLEDKLLDAVVSCMEVAEVPEKMVLDMGSTQYRNNLMRMLQDGMASKDDLEKLLTEELIDEYIVKNKKDLEDMVKFNLAVDKIYDAEALTIDESDIKAEMDMQKQQYDAQGLEYETAMLRDQVLDSFKHVKVIEWLKDNVKRTVEPYVPSATA